MNRLVDSTADPDWLVDAANQLNQAEESLTAFLMGTNGNFKGILSVLYCLILLLFHTCIVCSAKSEFFFFYLTSIVNPNPKKISMILLDLNPSYSSETDSEQNMYRYVVFNKDSYIKSQIKRS
jgi:hypothetical protein